VYRQFTRVGAEKVPDAKTLGKLAVALGPEIIEQIHRRVMAIAHERQIIRGRRLRLDTTVVETDIHSMPKLKDPNVWFQNALKVTEDPAASGWLKNALVVRKNCFSHNRAPGSMEVFVTQPADLRRGKQTMASNAE
jgi:hypothetical protein